jgi:hypothetical protein
MKSLEDSMATRKPTSLWLRSLLVIGTLVAYLLSDYAVEHSLAQPPDAPQPLLVGASEPSDEKGGVTERAVPGVPTLQMPAPLSALSLGLQTVTGGAPVTAFINLNAPAPAGGVHVNLTSDNPTVAKVPAAVIVPAGMSVTSFTIDTFPINSNPNVMPPGATIVITASTGHTAKQANLTVLTPMVSSVVLNPPAVTGGHPITGTVTLTGPVPAAGVTVHLASSNPSVSQVAPSVQITNGKTGSFQFTPSPVPDNTPIDITASRSPFDGQTVRLTVLRPVLASVKVTPAQVVGCSDATLTVTMTGKMPTGVDAQIQMTSSSPLVIVPSTMIVPSGTDWSGTVITTRSSTSTFSATITGHYQGNQDTHPTPGGLKFDLPMATLTVQPLLPHNLTLNPANVVGGSPSTGNVALNGPACAGGINVGLSSNTPTTAQVPPYATVQQGQVKSQNFAVTTQPVTNKTQVEISAFDSGGTAKGNLTVYPPAQADLYFYNVSYLDGSGSPINSPQPGQPFKVCPNIVNGGSAKADASKLVVKMVRSGDTNNPTIWEQDVPALNPGTGANPCIDVPSLGSGQTYDFNLYADNYNVVNESNEANNYLYRSFAF